MKTSEIISRINQQKNGNTITGVSGNDGQVINSAISAETFEQENEKTIIMITKVTAKPNPFFTSITLDVVCEQSKHTIVRMFDMDNRIVKMFSWYLVKGTNVTTINELNSLSGGTYFVDIIDSEAQVLYATKLRKDTK
ncbi:MAG: hypothetical protein EOO02_09070 [Chitinophagaceae bacterium]|nr:MAG: hypothetical protein EOO02_09070 [Chitinophagaceae bacterium]